MKHTRTLVGFCCLTAIVAGVAIAQPSDKKTQPPAGAMPDMKAMKKAMEEAKAVGEMHKFLNSKCGVWEGKTKFWMDPSGEPDEGTCTTTITSMMDGMFTKGETHGTMKDMDKKTVPFEGFGIYGYNNATEKFEANWIDNMSTMQMRMDGKLSDDKKVLTWESKFFCPMMHMDTWMREVETMTGPDSMTLEFYGPDPSGKNAEYRMGEIKFARKAGTAPKTVMPVKPTR